MLLTAHNRYVILIKWLGTTSQHQTKQVLNKVLTFITGMLYLIHKLSCLLQLAIHKHKRGRLIAVENVAMRKRDGSEFGRYDLLIAGHNRKTCRA